jgi:hypothetical protein
MQEDYAAWREEWVTVLAEINRELQVGLDSKPPSPCQHQ